MVSRLTSADWAASVRANISDEATRADPAQYGAVYYAPEDHGTAHISVLAENGDAVSATSTINL